MCAVEEITDALVLRLDTAELPQQLLEQRLLLKDGVAPSMTECFSDFSRAYAALVRAREVQ